MNRTVTTLLIASCLIPAGCADAPLDVPLTDAPPITGGTLAITADGLAVAADPGRDVVWLVDLSTRDVSSVPLTAGDQPGRVAVDAAGRAHVVLRGSGEVVTIDGRAAALVERRQVCPAPRGIAYQAGADLVHVACAGGELVTLPAAGGPPVRTLRLDRDLRDVVVQGDTLLVSRFRTAELLAVSGAGQVLQRRSPLAAASDAFAMATPNVAWRTLALPGGGTAMVHQLATSTSVGTDSGAYAWGGPCSGPIVASTVTFFEADGSLSDTMAMPALNAALPVDFAADANGRLAVVSAGDMRVNFPGSRQTLADSANLGGCPIFDSFDGDSSGGSISLNVTPIAVAAWNGRWYVQTQEHAQLLEIEDGDVSSIDLGGQRIASAGSSFFHKTWNGVACASCHPEGSEDGHTWIFNNIGARRTQTLVGGVMGRAPFHWRGELTDLDAVVDEVFVKRMEGASAGAPTVHALGRWLDNLPAPPASPRGTAAQLEHGRQLFHDPLVGCATCHAGEDLSDNQRHDVGTGASFQVASLVGIAARAPFFHDGCAATLEERFDPNKKSCNGGDLHGQTSQLDATEISDLITYLESL